MDIKPIRTEADYDALIRGIEGLLDAEEGSSEEEHLEVLSVLTEAW